MEETIKVTVTLPVEEYNRLRKLEEALNEKKVVVYDSSFYFSNKIEYLSESDALFDLKNKFKENIDRLNKKNDYQNDRIKYLLNRNIIQRIFNIDNYKPLSRR